MVEQNFQLVTLSPLTSIWFRIPLEVASQECTVIVPTKTDIFLQPPLAESRVSCIPRILNQLEQHSFQASNTFRRQIEPTLPTKQSTESIIAAISSPKTVRIYVQFVCVVCYAHFIPLKQMKENEIRVEQGPFAFDVFKHPKFPTFIVQTGWILAWCSISIT